MFFRHRICALAANYAAEAHAFLGNFTKASRLLERCSGSGSSPSPGLSLDHPKEKRQQQQQQQQQQQHNHHQQQQQQEEEEDNNKREDTEMHRVTYANGLVVKLLNGKLGDTERVYGAFSMNEDKELSSYPEMSPTLLYASYRLGHIPDR